MHESAKICWRRNGDHKIWMAWPEDYREKALLLLWPVLLSSWYDWSQGSSHQNGSASRWDESLKGQVPPGAAKTAKLVQKGCVERTSRTFGMWDRTASLPPTHWMLTPGCQRMAATSCTPRYLSPSSGDNEFDWIWRLRPWWRERGMFFFGGVTIKMKPLREVVDWMFHTSWLTGCFEKCPN